MSRGNRKTSILQRKGLARQMMSLLLALTMVLAMMPSVAFAAGTGSLTVAGQQLNDGASINCGGGTASYNNGVLTLTNATIEGGHCLYI